MAFPDGRKIRDVTQRFNDGELERPHVLFLRVSALETNSYVKLCQIKSIFTLFKLYSDFFCFSFNFVSSADIFFKT